MKWDMLEQILNTGLNLNNTDQETHLPACMPEACKPAGRDEHR